MIPPATKAVIDARCYVRWSIDLRAALDGHYGAFRVPWIDGQRGEPGPDFQRFVEEHAESWLSMTLRAEGSP